MSADYGTKTIKTSRQSSVSYFDNGSGEPLIMLHGTEGDLRGYTNLVASIGDGIRTLPYTQRDIDAPHDDAPAAYEMADLADDCIALLDALELPTAHILGASFGGGLALHIAARHPDRVRSLVLAAAPPSWEMVEPLPPEFSSADPDDRKRIMLDALVAPEIVAADPTLTDQMQTILTARTPEQRERRMSALTNHDGTGGLAAISSPTLVLHGAGDPLVTVDTARWLADNIVGSQLTILPDARHGVFLYPAQESAEIVRAFVLENS
jgi:3-oxoadipate enol-lactonase